MPTYDYRCQECGHEFELFQSMTAKLKRKCPECSEPKLKRLIGAGGAVIFKGSGFYETDYRSESYKKAAEADKKKAEKKDDKKDTSKDAKKPAKEPKTTAKKKDE